jgi:hypothetical protein
MESIDVAESGYPEENPAGSAPDDAPGAAPQERAADPGDAASNAPNNDEGRTATGNPQTDRKSG